MLEKIWQFAVLANFPSVATAYTGKLVFCLYVVCTSSLNEMCYTGRLLPLPPTYSSIYFGVQYTTQVLTLPLLV